MQPIRVAVPDETYLKLRELAEREVRSPRAQASVLLAEAIERKHRLTIKTPRPSQANR